jgi:hypothetical protein
MTEDKTTIHVFRLMPGQDLKKYIWHYVMEHQLEAAWVLTAVGSLTNYSIRFASQAEPASSKGHFEILGLSGTMGLDGVHLHISIADSKGKTLGGHLMEGCLVFTTVELVIQEGNSISFNRKHDGSTPWKELDIRKRAMK